MANNTNVNEGGGPVRFREPNYDEAKVPPYTLEDPLAFADGRKLADAARRGAWPFRLRLALDARLRRPGLRHRRWRVRRRQSMGRTA